MFEAYRAFGGVERLELRTRADLAKLKALLDRPTGATPNLDANSLVALASAIAGEPAYQSVLSQSERMEAVRLVWNWLWSDRSGIDPCRKPNLANSLANPLVWTDLAKSAALLAILRQHAVPVRRLDCEGDRDTITTAISGYFGLAKVLASLGDRKGATAIIQEVARLYPPTGLPTRIRLDYLEGRLDAEAIIAQGGLR